MNLFRTILLALLALAPTTQQATQLEAPASIRGVVINASTEAPVPNAIVELTFVDPREQGRVVSHSDRTDKNGVFEIRNLLPGSNYQLTASDPGNFTPGAFGQHNSKDPWTSITLSAGQNMTDVRLVLTPLSSISGKVVDAAGKPLSRANVVVLRATYSGGRRILEQAGTRMTTDQGMYFIGQLGSGQFYVRANPSNASDYRQLFESPADWDRIKNSKGSEPEGYPTTYHPGTMDLTAAKPVDLLNGGKAENINVVVAKVRTRRVSGKVINEVENRPVGSASVLLVPRTAGSESSFTRRLNLLGDEFDFRGVLPGNYYLIAIVTDGKSLATGRKPLEIREDLRDSDLQRLSIAVERGTDISGTIRFEDWEDGRPPDYSQFAVNLIPDNFGPIDRTTAGTRYTQQTLTVPPSSDGKFVLRNIAPGEYRIVFSINPQFTPVTKIPLDLRAAYMTSMRLGDTDVLDNGIRIDGKPQGDIQITVSTKSGAIYGRVLDENRELTVPARMVIVPEKIRRARFDLFTLVGVSPTGRFTTDGIPPGDYKIFAWAHVEDNAWLDPAFMRVYEDRGVPVHIEESSSYPLDIPLIH